MDRLDRLLELIGEIMALLTRNGGPAQGFGQNTGQVTLTNDGTSTTTTKRHYGVSRGDRIDLTPVNAAAATLENGGAVYGTGTKGLITITHPATTATAVFKYSFEHLEPVRTGNTTGIIVPPVVVVPPTDPTPPPPVDPTPPPVSSLAGTPDSVGSISTFSWSGQLPTLSNTGYRGTLTPYTAITTNSSASIYRSGNIIFLKGTNPVLSGYDCQGAEVQPQAPNWTIQDCLFDAASGFHTIYIPTGYTVPVNGSILHCTFDGKKVNNNSHGDFFFCDPRIHQSAVRFNQFLNAPADCITFGGSCGLITHNYFRGQGYRVGAHPDCITFNAGYANQLESIVAYNVCDPTDPAGGTVVASSSTVSIKDNADARSNYFIYRNLHKGSSVQHQIDDGRSSKIEFSENARYVLNGPPIYANPGADAAWDGPYGAYYGGIYTSSSDIMIHDDIEARDGLQSYELLGGNYPDNTQRGSQKVEKAATGRPGQVTITSISTAGAFSIGAVSGATSYQYRTSIAGTGAFGAWTTLTTSGSGPLTGTLALISNAYNHVLIRAVNANGPGPVSRTYQVSSALVANQAPGFTANPVVSGTTQVGSTLTTTDGTYSGSPSPTPTRQWQRDADGSGNVWSDILDATATTYIPTSSELNKRVRSKVRVTNGVGTPGYAEAFSGATAVITAPVAAGTISFASVGSVGTSAMTTGTGTVSATAGAPSGTGGLLLLAARYYSIDTSTIPTPSGWTRVTGYDFFGTGGVVVFSKTGGGSDPSVTITASDGRASDFLMVQQARFTGGSGVVHAGTSEFGNTITSNGGLASGGANRLSVVWWSWEWDAATGGSAVTGTAPTGYTERAETSNSTASSYMPTLALDTANALTTGATTVTPGNRTWSTPDKRTAFAHLLVY
jgi:hypothetical protein